MVVPAWCLKRKICIINHKFVNNVRAAPGECCRLQFVEQQTVAAEVPESSDLLLRRSLGFAPGRWRRLSSLSCGWCCSVRAALGWAAPEPGGDSKSMFYTSMPWWMGAFVSSNSAFLGTERKHMPPNIHFSNMLACLCCMVLNNWELKSPGGLEHNH